MLVAAPRGLSGQLSPGRVVIESTLALGLIVCGVVLLAKPRSPLMPGIVLGSINVFISFAANTILAKETLRMEDGSLGMAAITTTIGAIPLILAITAAQAAAFARLVHGVRATPPRNGPSQRTVAATPGSAPALVAFRCVRCQKALKSASKNRGRQIACPGCRSPMVVP